MSSLSTSRKTFPLRLIPSALAALFVLAGCGGGGGSPSVGAPPVAQNPAPTTPAPTPVPTPPVATQPTPEDLNPNLLGDAYGSYWNKCAVPRTGLDASGKSYPDVQGTLLDELKFLRAWANQYYLWYDEIPNTYKMADFKSALDYFAVLKTPALTASGKPKDRYHFTYPTAEWEAMQTQGIDLGYGITWSRNADGLAPRTWLITAVEPGSPAAAAGLLRGDMLLKVDGVDFVNADDEASVDRINAGLFPASAGTTHRFTLQRAGVAYEATLAGAEVVLAPVKNVKVIETASGKVGYLTFDSFNAVSEKQLYDAFVTFQQAGVNDLVLDVRYNGGGLLYVASQLAYMIAGPASTSGKVFEQSRYNDKTPAYQPIMFRSTAWGFASSNPLRTGTPLPTLGLKRVTVLSTPGTCSASESVINGLRGADIEVIQIGGTTCGKPYGFTPVPNCGTTYFSIEFQGVNHKGFGDFTDGFTPTCQASDDLSRPVGDQNEGLLATALAYRANGACPVSTTARARVVPMRIVRPEVKEISIHTTPGAPPR
ncbi:MULTISPECIES: S41 family peptidase [Massilia]|uniref:S41 family peptidase n=1 Tax=Massilia TaxID=149698 RepID=UPI001C639031|nr:MULTISPECIES: S41 family peptidase [Massilia]QYG00604.1 PDZ domain-containing protein [Massilia sp. NP310]